MASVGGGSSNSNSSYDPKANYAFPLALMVTLFFLFGFVTVMNDILIPHLKGLFDLANWQAMLVQSCFFGAFFLMSGPAGWVIGKMGYKKGIIAALGVLAVGLLLFVPASMVVSYAFFLFALFVVGTGIAILQVAANPYISALGHPDKAAMRLNLAGSFNSLATTIGPMIGAALIFVDSTASAIEKAESVRLPYIGVAVFVGILAIAISMAKLPKIIPTEDDSSEDEASTESIWNHRHLILGALAIFFYVGAEVACGSIIINYFNLPEMGGMEEKQAADYVSFYWGGLMVGRIIGIFALQKFKMEKALLFVSSIALVLVLTTMITTGSIAVWSIVAVGLCCSVMWPCIFPLGIKGLGTLTGKGSGLMVSMIVGGAVLPVIQGALADTIGYSFSFIIVLLAFAYLAFYALKGHKIKNQKVEEIEEVLDGE